MNNSFPRRFDSFLDAIQSVLMSILVKIGPFFTALMPAMFSAYSIFHTFKSEAGPLLALLFAFVVGLALETVGIVATHTAIDLYNAKQAKLVEPAKFRLMVWLVPIYVLGVAAVVYFSEDAFTPLVKGLGVASPFLTCIIYIAVALARDLANIEAKQESIDEKQDIIEAEDRQWKREQEQRKAEMKHAENLAKIKAQNSVSTVSHETVKDKTLETLKDEIIAELGQEKPNMSQLAARLDIGRSTLYRHLETLRETGEVTKNGHGYKPIGGNE